MRILEPTPLRGECGLIKCWYSTADYDLLASRESDEHHASALAPHPSKKQSKIPPTAIL